MSSSDEPADLFEEPPDAHAPRAGGSTDDWVGDDPTDPPPTVREPVAALAAVVLFDLLIYRTGGYAAAGLFLLGLIPVVAFGSPFRQSNWRGFAVVAGLLVLTAGRLAWLGWGGAVAAGIALLVALGLARAGRKVWVLDLPIQALQAFPAAPAAVVALRNLLGRDHADGAGTGSHRDSGVRGAGRTSNSLSVLMPIAAGAVFAGLFLLANPDLKEMVGEWLASVSARFGDAIRWIVPGPVQVFLWVVVGGATLGSLRPLVRGSLLDLTADREAAATARRRASRGTPSHAYSAVRNTLLVVVGVFAVYLPFEFATLWRRNFPEDFYYAGYAHEGAAWLTAALAAATALLSAMFRGSLISDPRAGRLRTLAWIWSGLNFLLVAAVLNRLLNYVDFNGLSRMRIVGFLGIAAVAVGFAIVVAKIAWDRGFTWLVRRQARAAALVLLAGLLFPIDWMAHTYNASRVANDDLPPLALIGNHAIDLGGLLALEPLLESDNPVVARGVAARMTLAARALDAPRDADAPTAVARLGRYQLARRQFEAMLQRNRARIEALLNGDAPATVAEELAVYGMRWW
ncbi:DUF4153 domain-containing protein [Alienimonas chondri]|uniref:DUF4173 domain-containing protein n=1 Tax=Alienimonas chondri TaxID=2681879 RepID=A0ABX1V749_9PLAN|nr:DUF4153 domain-containing protein [Alienimonas chondri]NNJ24084.1 hypothetical protein [Alienimonas chondri]